MLFKKVTDLCKQNGITFWKLEKVLKFGNGTIAKWSNSVPNVAKVKKVADYFNVSVDFLLDRPCASNISEAGKVIALEFDKLSPEKRELIQKYIGFIKAS